MTAPVEPQCLILVDLQRSFVEGETAVPRTVELLKAARVQLKNARRAGAVVVHLQNDGTAATLDEPGTWEWELLLTPEPTEVVIRKSEDCGFTGTNLEDVLQARGVTDISICGLMSEMCVAATARTAVQLGYRVVLAHDSHATYPVPAYGPDEDGVPAELAARVAEWSLGDSILIPARGTAVSFRSPGTS